MENVDLNLLIALDVLLTEGSVTKAARRLALSSSAMSRTLKRLRLATGDPLLVRAGRGLVPTPYAVTLRQRVHEAAQEAQTLLRPKTEPLEPASLNMTYTIRANETFVASFSTQLSMDIARSAPQVRLRFAPKPDKDISPLREGLIDLEIGVIDEPAPEMHTQFLFRDRYVGITRSGHPLIKGSGVTPERYAACRHVVASRKAAFKGPVDEALESIGLSRDIALVVPGFPDAMRIARHSDLVALVPRSALGNALPDSGPAEAAGLAEFELPVQTPDIMIHAMWHPRVDADPAHQWVRNIVTTLCMKAYPRGTSPL